MINSEDSPIKYVQYLPQKQQFKGNDDMIRFDEKEAHENQLV
jgi:hypothetical protein